MRKKLIYTDLLIFNRTRFRVCVFQSRERGMESSGSEATDCIVGSIVWVRRRNGSWWPGKILGSDELSATHVMSPRSGTPVKLLGREDASVDWYNLEKSKRVKAFRCGEFDDCIQRAESSQGMPIKKREKYARREDAILHALELEKQFLEEKQKKLGTIFPAPPKRKKQLKKKVSPPSPEVSTSRAENGKPGNIKSHKLPKRSSPPLQVQTPKEEDKKPREDDNSEAVPRMRGLQDFGLKIAAAKRKLSSLVPSNGSDADGSCTATVSTSHASIDKRKKSIELTEDIVGKKQNAKLPLAQPGTSTVSLSVPVVDHSVNTYRAKRTRCVYMAGESNDCLVNSESVLSQIDSPSQIGESTEKKEISVSVSDSDSDSASDSSETQDLKQNSSDEEMNEPSDATVSSSEKSMGGAEESHIQIQDPISFDPGVSKWQMKGKRNIRNLSKRCVDSTEGKRSFPLDENRRYFSGPTAEGFLNRGGRNNRTVLFDVDLKVQARYQKEHVPIVSLMSRLNGKAIVGHPIQIETLPDGGSDFLFSSRNDFGYNEGDNNKALPSVWRTARRTANYRVPRARQSVQRRTLPPPQRKPQPPLPKRVSFSSTSNQKTRTLSSLVIEQKQKLSHHQKLPNVDEDRKNGVIIKPDCGPTTVACIPVKLVFSRLYEAVGRLPLPSIAGNHHENRNTKV